MKINRNSQIHVTSVDFNSKKIHKDKIFERQNILQFFSGVSKDYKYVKSLTWDRHFKYICISSTLHVVSDVQARVESSSILTSVPVYSAVTFGPVMFWSKSKSKSKSEFLLSVREDVLVKISYKNRSPEISVNLWKVPHRDETRYRLLNYI